MDEELTDVERREILTYTLAGLAGLGVEFTPDGDLRLGTEPLDQIAAHLGKLRVLDSRKGAARILVPAVYVADQLGRLLAKTTSQSSLHRRLAEVTADAAMLARWATMEVGDTRQGLRWSKTARWAADAALSPDLQALAGAVHADTLDIGLGQRAAALGVFSKIRLDGVSTPTRVYVEGQRGRAFARAGANKSSLSALDRAADAPAQPSGVAPMVVLSFKVPLNKGYALTDLGQGQKAQEQLMGVLRTYDASHVRSAGTIHLRLAAAAVLTHEPVKAAKHVVKAHQALTATRSARRLGELRSIVVDLRTDYGDVRAVKELDERLRTDARYRICLTEDQKTFRVHLATCRYARRGQARGWLKAEQLDPAEAARIAVQSGHLVCARCMPA